jgi:PIN domain nuclease of toxin-antitoxin system
MQADRRLGPVARQMITTSAQAGGIYISAITPWEIAMLVHKGRLALGQAVGAWIDSVLAMPGILMAPIEPAIAVDSVLLPGSFHADPADRLIVATARHKALPLVTADRSILEYGAQGHLIIVDAGN